MQVRDLMYILSKLPPESEIHYYVEDEKTNKEWLLETPESLLWVIHHEIGDDNVYLHVSDVIEEHYKRMKDVNKRK